MGKQSKGNDGARALCPYTCRCHRSHLPVCGFPTGRSPVGELSAGYPHRCHHAVRSLFKHRLVHELLDEEHSPAAVAEQVVRM